MKLNRKLFVAGAVALACTSVGGTFAYYKAAATAEGGKTINVQPTTEITENLDGNNKIVSVTNTGDTDLYIRVVGYGSIGASGSGWSQSGDYYYYGSVIKPGETTSTIEFTVDDTDKDRDFDVVVVEEATPAIFDIDDDGTLDANDASYYGWSDKAIYFGQTVEEAN